MSETLRVATESASSTITLGSSEFTAPIAKILPYFKIVYSGLKYLFGFILSLTRPLLHLSPLPILLYILAPVVVFVDIVATVFIRSPYRTIAYLLDALFPLYVFCGVACITGVVLGLTARGLSRVIVTAVAVDGEPSDLTNDSQGPKVVVDVKGKSRKVERVKFES